MTAAGQSSPSAEELARRGANRRRADTLGVAGSDGLVTAVGVAVVLAGLALAAIRMVGASPAESIAEQVAGGVALGGLVATPGVLALLARRDRPALLLPTVIVLVPLSFLSLAGITLPLLVPAVMLAVGYGRRSAALVATGQPVRHPLLAATVVLPLLLAAGAALFVHADPRSYSTALESGSTSDVITPLEALASLALQAAAVVAGWRLAGNRSVGR